MLVITRKRRQRVSINVPGYDQPIFVSVERCFSSHVRLGFVAPSEIKIHREQDSTSPRLAAEDGTDPACA